MDNNSANGMKFGFGKSDADKDEQKIDETISPVEGADDNKPAPAVDAAPQEDVEEEYTDNRSVTVM